MARRSIIDPVVEQRRDTDDHAKREYRASSGWRKRSWQFKNKEAQELSDAALKASRVAVAFSAVIGIVLIVGGISKL